MADPVSYAHITVTKLDNGSVQYDVIPHDKIEEGAIVLLDQDGVLSIRDEDGQYLPIAGRGYANIYDYDPDVSLPVFPLPDNQIFEDMENSVDISIYRNNQGALVVDVNTDDGVRSQFVGIVPSENYGTEQRTLIEGDKIGVINTDTGPDGLERAQVPPSFKI